MVIVIDTLASPGPDAVTRIGYAPGVPVPELVKLIAKLLPVTGLVRAVVTPAGTPDTVIVTGPA